MNDNVKLLHYLNFLCLLFDEMKQIMQERFKSNHSYLSELKSLYLFFD